jgi:hypothetical protein
MEDDVLKKIITIRGQKVELYSVDGELWSTDLPQLKRIAREREERTEKVVDEARRFFRGRVGLR